MKEKSLHNFHTQIESLAQENSFFLSLYLRQLNIVVKDTCSARPFWPRTDFSQQVSTVWAYLQILLELTCLLFRIFLVEHYRGSSPPSCGAKQGPLNGFSSRDGFAGSKPVCPGVVGFVGCVFTEGEEERRGGRRRIGGRK